MIIGKRALGYTYVHTFMCAHSILQYTYVRNITSVSSRGKQHYNALFVQATIPYYSYYYNYCCDTDDAISYNSLLKAPTVVSVFTHYVITVYTDALFLSNDTHFYNHKCSVLCIFCIFYCVLTCTFNTAVLYKFKTKLSVLKT